MEAKVNTFVQAIGQFGLRVLAAAIILALGYWLARAVKGLLRPNLENRGIEPTLIGFFTNLAYAAILVFAAIAAIGKLGVETTSFAALVAAAGLAIGLALQGSLSNFASGILLILFKPIKVGDFVDVGGTMGTVLEVGMLFTEMNSPDNKKITMPNSQIMGTTLVNFSVNKTRRVDMMIGVGYAEDLEKVKNILRDMLEQDGRVLKDPAPFLGVMQLGDSSIDFAVRPWVNSGDYLVFMTDFYKAVKARFEAEGINIPFPQRDIHLYQNKQS